MRRELEAAEVHWLARVMQIQGSRFYAHLGAAPEAADLANRRKMYATWTEDLYAFELRARELAAQEE